LCRCQEIFILFAIGLSLLLSLNSIHEISPEMSPHPHCLSRPWEYSTPFTELYYLWYYPLMITPDQLCK
jgi:hypothetical protein